MENISTTVSWGVETRTLEDTTATSILDATGSFSTGDTGVEVLQNGSTKPAKELVRYKISVGGTTPNNTDFVVLRALQPSWQQDR